MGSFFGTSGGKLTDYVHRVSLRETPTLKGLREATARLPERGWECDPDEGQFLALLVEMIGAKRVLELGTFTGYGTLWMAAALPPDGHIVTCDLMETYPAVGRPFWEEAGVAGKIELRLGPAVESTEKLIEEGQAGTFDMVFIDANKKDYGTYYENALVLLRPGGVIAVDNVFWGGAVLEKNSTAKSTRAIQALNEKMGKDERISSIILPLADGVTVAVKRR